MDFAHPSRCQQQRTRRENRHLNLYKRRDNPRIAQPLPAANVASDAQGRCLYSHAHNACNFRIRGEASGLYVLNRDGSN